MFRIVFLLIIVAFVEVYAFQAIKTLTNSKPLIFSYIGISLGVIIFVFYELTQFDRKIGQTSMTMLTLGVLLLVIVPKLILGFFLLLEDLIRIAIGIKNYFIGTTESASFLPNRRKFISQIALGVASIPFVSLLYGMTKGKYNFKVLKQTIFYNDLPDSFDGFQITQISDIHSGSFDDAEKIEFAIDLINQQNSDMIMFTGDIVNTHATEMHPWIETFKKIKPHKYGKFSVLGNHDYGEYIDWNSQAEKDANFEAIKNLYGDIDFKLLLNENVRVTKDQNEIAIVGVENWGNNFKKLGDIDKATSDLNSSDFKILMSHDPSHWNFIVKDHPKNIHLTLSGHTHGFQFGIEIPGFLKWSPVQYVYKQWAGLYENLGRYIYVNRGFGFHAYPGRVGIWPEITVIELRKKLS
jgi:predicted MPP superfamily phosphohydrolase